jgi:hypothetical protein
MTEKIISLMQPSLKYTSYFSSYYKSVNPAATIIEALDVSAICKLLNNPIWPYIIFHRSVLYSEVRESIIPEKLVTLQFCTVTKSVAMSNTMLSHGTGTKNSRVCFHMWQEVEAVLLAEVQNYCNTVAEQTPTQAALSPAPTENPEYSYYPQANPQQTVMCEASVVKEDVTEQTVYSGYGMP